jgi:hypothetical protein
MVVIKNRSGTKTNPKRIPKSWLESAFFFSSSDKSSFFFSSVAVMKMTIERANQMAQNRKQTLGR